jgi:hypothetical protein
MVRRRFFAPLRMTGDPLVVTGAALRVMKRGFFGFASE